MGEIKDSIPKKDKQQIKYYNSVDEQKLSRTDKPCGMLCTGPSGVLFMSVNRMKDGWIDAASSVMRKELS